MSVLVKIVTLAVQFVFALGRSFKHVGLGRTSVLKTKNQRMVGKTGMFTLVLQVSFHHLVSFTRRL